MQRSTLLTVAGILIIICSCLALIAALFMAFFVWFDYFVPSHLGSVSGISEAFYVEISIIFFEFYAFVLGVLSAINIFKLKSFNLSVVGSSTLLIAGLLFFGKLAYSYIPHVAAIFQNPWSPIIFTGFWSPISQPWFGFSIIILASVSMILLASKKKEFVINKNNLLTALEAFLISVILISALFAILSIIPYEEAAESALIQSAGFPSLAAYSPIATMIVNICAFVFSTLAGLLLFTRKRFSASIVLIVLTLITAISLSFIFTLIYPWIGSFVKGLVTESPIIILSAIALALALIGRRSRNQVTTKSIDAQISV